MAPERLRGQGDDQRTDQFAFGVVCYELLSGRLPFRGTTVYEISNAPSVRNRPPSLSIAPDLPPEIGLIAHRMLAKDPAERLPRPTKCPPL